jgi:aryl-alcohol dehydrogenase-like predicted oxidoreductase
MGGGGWKYSWGPQDDRKSVDTIRRACDLGVNWVDTAAVYGLGHSEEVLGRALKELREKPFIATKCGRTWDRQGEIWSELKKETIQSEIELSLKRLQVEVIDLYQIHWPEPDEALEEAWGVVADAVKSGKIRYAGMCNCSVGHLKRISELHPVASLQVPYSVLRRDIEHEILRFCGENNIGVVVYSPMQKGLLTGQFSKEMVDHLPNDDHRHRDPMFQEPKLTSVLRTVEGLRSIAQRRGRTVGELSIAWCLRRPEITSAIVGARHPAQIEETAPGGDWELSAEDVAAVDNVLAVR